MFARAAAPARAREQPEGPFWISFADLMTALMTLFLLVMCVTLLAVTRKVDGEEQRKSARERDVGQVMSALEDAARPWPQVRVDVLAQRIDLGDLLRFDSGRHDISPEGARLLRAVVPAMLDAHRTPLGRRWIRQIVIEGFADQDGDYLFNLGLSLDRSKEVVCALFRAPLPDETPLSDATRREIRDLFVVGGYSFNSAKASKRASRRVELKVDFWRLDDVPGAPVPDADKAFGRC